MLKLFSGVSNGKVLHERLSHTTGCKNTTYLFDKRLMVIRAHVVNECTGQQYIQQNA